MFKLNTYKITIGLVMFVAILYTYFKTRCENIESFESLSLNYVDLPKDVQNVYFQEYFHDVYSRKEFISLDSNSNVDYETTTLDDGIFTFLVYGHNHWFHIYNRCFKLKANKLDPFVFYNDNLYFIQDKVYRDSSYLYNTYVCYNLQ